MTLQTSSVVCFCFCYILTLGAAMQHITALFVRINASTICDSKHGVHYHFSVIWDTSNSLLLICDYLCRKGILFPNINNKTIANINIRPLKQFFDTKLDSSKTPGLGIQHLCDMHDCLTLSLKVNFVIRICLRLPDWPPWTHVTLLIVQL